MKLLIVIDMQNDFVTGCLGTPEARAIVPNVKKKIEEWDGDLIYTRDTHLDNYLDTPEGKKLPIPHCIEDTDGWQIVDDVFTDKNYTRIIDKRTFGYLGWSWELDSFTGGCHYDEIQLIGLTSNICVVTNALILKTRYPEVEIIVDASCCAGTTPQAHRAAMEIMKSCQITVIGE